MNKTEEVKYLKIISLYHHWKELNRQIKELYTRGINFHEVFSEIIVCYVNDCYHSIGEGSEDAFTKDNLKVQIKSTSNFNSDLTSFGPNSKFDILEFARLDQDSDYLYLYKIPIKKLNKINVNKNQTFKQQQEENRRPRFSIINTFIKPYNIQPYAKIDMKN